MGNEKVLNFNVVLAQFVLLELVNLHNPQVQSDDVAH